MKPRTQRGVMQLDQILRSRCTRLHAAIVPNCVTRNRMKIYIVHRMWQSASLLVTVSVLCVGCRHLPTNPELATSSRPAKSPSEKYRLVVVEGFDGNQRFATFQVCSNERYPRVLYCAKTSFRTRDTIRFFWSPDDEVWVYSSDLGVYYWTRVLDTDWRRHEYLDGQPGAPTLLKQIESGQLQ
jgi:hypothetical protein